MLIGVRLIGAAQVLLLARGGKGQLPLSATPCMVVSYVVISIVGSSIV